MARSSASTRRLPLSRLAPLVGALLCALGLGACSAPLTSTGVNAPAITPVESSVSSVVVLPTTDPTTTSSVPVVTTAPPTTTHTVTHPVTHAPTHTAAPVHTAPKHAVTAAPTKKKASSCSADYYLNSSGNCVHRPETAPAAPAGATAKCNDGTYSFSQHHSGTCSGHHGVAEWL
jgi:hypothetical protein